MSIVYVVECAHLTDVTYSCHRRERAAMRSLKAVRNRGYSAMIRRVFDDAHMEPVWCDGTYVLQEIPPEKCGALIIEAMEDEDGEIDEDSGGNEYEIRTMAQARALTSDPALLDIIAQTMKGECEVESLWKKKEGVIAEGLCVIRSL